MLTHIKKIKSLGVFDNYAAPPELKAFDRFNIVYGENGSGKTTFSRFLACLPHAKAGHQGSRLGVRSKTGPLRQGVAAPGSTWTVLASSG